MILNSGDTKMGSLLILMIFVSSFSIASDVSLSDQFLKNIANENSLMINDRIASLNNLYDGHVPLAKDFKVGQKILKALLSAEIIEIHSNRTELSRMCINYYCLRRDFNEISLESSSTGLKNFVDVMNMAKNIRDDPAVYPPLTIITGDARSGKTVALAQLEHEILKLKPYSWIIRVDFINEFPTETSLIDLTYENIIKKHIHPDYENFFHSVMWTNPREVFFMFDGIIDMTPGERADQIDMVMDKIIRSRAKIIVACDPISAEKFYRNYETEIFKLQELNMTETNKFYNMKWRTDIDNIIDEGTLTPQKQTVMEQRLAHYSDKFTHLLFKTDLPKQPFLLNILAEVFSRQTSPLILWAPKNYTIGCIDYVFGSMALSRNLTAVLEQVYIDKLAVFKMIDNDINKHYKDLTPFYELLAIDASLKRVETSEKAEEYLIFYGSIISVVPNMLSNTYAPLIHLNKFINAQYERYYASIFLAVQKTEKIQSLTPLHINILMKKEYEGILEFLNLRQDFNITKVIFDSASDYIKLVIMYNLIDSGLETLFLQQHRLFLSSTFDSNHLRMLYFYGSRIVDCKHRIWRMVQSSSRLDLNSQTTQPVASNDRTSIQIMVENNMLESLKVLYVTGFWFKRTDSHYEQHYLNLLYCAVTKAIPNMEMVEFLFMKSPMIISVDQLSSLLYDVVYHVGEESEMVVDYLVKKGARTDFIKTNRTVIHAALRWNSVNLLRYLMEDLQAPIVDTETSPNYSVFEAALDANPSPFYTVAGWWDMMLYLVSRMNLIQYPLDGTLLRRTFSIPVEDVNSPWFKLMIFADVSTRSQDNNPWSIKCLPIEQNTAVTSNLTELAKQFGFTAWPLSSDTLALRRLAIIDQLNESDIKRVLPFEMFVYYRGVSTLSKAQMDKYGKIIKILFKNEQQSMVAMDGIRIFQTMVYTIRSQDDYSLYCSLLKLVVNRLLTFNQIILNLDLVHNYINAHSIDNNSTMSEVSLADRFNMNLFYSMPVLSDTLEINKKNKLLSKRMTKTLAGKSSNDKNIDENNAQISKCILLSISDRLSHCRIFWNEINAIGDFQMRYNIHNFRINSDRFISRLMNADMSAIGTQADQIVRWVANIIQHPLTTVTVTGNSQMQMQEIVQERSLTRYRHNLRIHDVVTRSFGPLAALGPRQSLGYIFYSKPTITYRIASTIPLIRSFDHALSLCLVQNYDIACLEDSLLVGSSALIFFGGPHAVKHIPRIVMHFVSTTIRYLEPAPEFIIENLLIFEHFGLKYGAQAGSIAFAAAGTALEIYNIGTKAKMLIECRRNPNAHDCNVKNRALSWISLSFSTVAVISTAFLLIANVGAVPLLLFALARVLIEAIAVGITNAAYYAHNYHTSLRDTTATFFRSLVFLPPSFKVQILKRRTDWIEVQNKHSIQYLNESKGVIGYATGLGYVTVGSVEPGWAYINMHKSSSKYTKQLSRVIPSAVDLSVIPVCLPAQNKSEPYDTDDSLVNSVSSAIYQCQNSFVHIKKPAVTASIKSEEEVILYNMKYIDAGRIIGSPIYNNLFWIFNSTNSLIIETAAGNVTNSFMFESEYFQGDIRLSNNGKRMNIFDWSAITDVRKMRFRWFPDNTGKIWSNKNYSVTIKSIQSDDVKNLFIHGRRNLKDQFECGEMGSSEDKTSIKVDGGGGRSKMRMDIVKTCKYSFIQPFTEIIGHSSNTNSSYKAYLQFPMLNASLSSDLPQSDKLFSKISVKNSQFVVIFSGSSLLTRIKRVTYFPSDRSLQWTLSYTNSKILNLTIVPYNFYALPNEDGKPEKTHNLRIHTLFLDEASGMIIYPTDAKSDDDGNSQSIVISELIGTVIIDDSSLDDIFSRYEEIMKMVNMQDLSLTIKFHTPNYDNNFIFGGSKDDRFLIDSNITSISGNNGSDLYILTSEAEGCIYIDNHADDRIFDKFLIHNHVCDSLVTISFATRTVCDQSYYSDMILRCIHEKKEETKHSNIVFRKYSESSSYRHLEIYWRNATYTLLPDTWVDGDDEFMNSQGHQDDMSRLAIFASFEKKWHHTVMLSSHDSHMVFYAADSDNPFAVYRSDNDAYICRKYWDRSGLPLIILEGFFANNTNEIAEVSEHWKNLKIYLVRDMTNDTYPKEIFTAQVVVNMYFSTIIDIDSDLDDDTEDNNGLLKEYYVNVNKTDNEQMIIIDLNNATTEKGPHYLGVLVISGAQPNDVTVQWNTSNDATLEFHFLGTTVAVKNWSKAPIKRLHRIEFINSVEQPAIIENLEDIEIDHQTENDFSSFNLHSSHQDLFLHRMQDKLNNAQEQYKLIQLIGHTDNSYLIRCVSALYIGFLSEEPVYGLLGFRTYLDQMKFLLTCIPLMTKTNIDALSQAHTVYLMKNMLHLALLREKGGSQVDMCYKLSDSLSNLSVECWQTFLSSLYNDNFLMNDGKHFGILEMLKNCTSIIT